MRQKLCLILFGLLLLAGLHLAGGASSEALAAARMVNGPANASSLQSISKRCHDFGGKHNDWRCHRHDGGMMKCRDFGGCHHHNGGGGGNGNGCYNGNDYSCDNGDGDGDVCDAVNNSIYDTNSGVVPPCDYSDDDGSGDVQPCDINTSDSACDGGDDE